MKYVFGAYNSEIAPRDDPFHPFSPEPNPNGPEPVPSGPYLHQPLQDTDQQPLS